jgi:chromate transporter
LKTRQIALASAKAACQILRMPSQPAAVSAPEPSTKSPPGVTALFFAFARMSLAGYGGVLPFARRGIVEQHRWMTADEFNETFALCHFLPGPNIVNFSMVFGARLRGIVGGIAAFAGLLLPPMLVMIVLAALYSHFGDIEALRRILAGVACAAVGLLIATVLRMMMPLFERRDVAGFIMLLAVLVAIGIARWPLAAVLLVAFPVALALSLFMQRKDAA